METFITVIHFIVCFLLIIAVLFQPGKGGGMGSALGGASGQIFGGRGATSLLVRVTTVLAVVFFVTSMSLSMLSSRQRSVVEAAGTDSETPSLRGETEAETQEAAAGADTQDEADIAADAEGLLDDAAAAVDDAEAAVDEMVNDVEDAASDAIAE